MESIIIWIITSILSFSIGYIIKTKKNYDKESKALKESILALLWERLNDVCEKYIGLDYLPEHARDCLTNMFMQYKTLGGNHGMEILVNECLKLPPIKKGKEVI